MRRLAVALVVASALGVVARAALAASLVVDSSAFWNGGTIPSIDAAPGCRGRNVSPPLRISGVPPGARSLAVIVFDTDADAGSGFVHWVAYGIDPGRSALPSGFGSAPGRYVAGKNDAGTNRYVGPCPPPGDSPHHYTFSVYALTIAPSVLPAGLTRAALLHAIAGKQLATATLAGTFAR